MSLTGLDTLRIHQIERHLKVYSAPQKGSVRAGQPPKSESRDPEKEVMVRLSGLTFKFPNLSRACKDLAFEASTKQRTELGTRGWFHTRTNILVWLTSSPCPWAAKEGQK